MVSNFGLLRIPRIFFGWGQTKNIAGLLKDRGKIMLVITGAKSYRQNPAIADMISSLENAGYLLHFARVKAEPSPNEVDSMVIKYRKTDPDIILAIGGGSVVDAGKAVSAMMPLGDSVRNYLEGVGSQNHPGIKKYFVAIPTTSGTGSETTANAVISETGMNGFKRSLRHDNLVPDMAIVDPMLTISCPAEITAASGMDAFTQLVESYISVKASALTDALAMEGIRCVQANLPEAVKHGDNPESRSGMSYAAMLSGITLANAGLGLIHGFASSIGGYHKIPHGVVCGTLMGIVNRYNVTALINQHEVTPAHEKYGKLGKLFSGRNNKPLFWYMEYAADYIEDLSEQLKMKHLGDFGITVDDLNHIAGNADHKANPVKFEKEQLVEMLESRL